MEWFPALLKTKVIDSHQWFHEEPLKFIQFFILKKVLYSEKKKGLDLKKKSYYY